MRKAGEATLESARLFIRRHFSKEVSPKFVFHDLDHTLSVTRTALEIGRALKLSGHDLLLLEIAALFHDAGYARTYVGHEKESARIARGFLHAAKFPTRDRERVSAMINGTRLGATPRGMLQRVLRDADSAKAGQVDFEERAERLRIELQLVHGKAIKKTDWSRENLAYLTAHRFHTTYARNRFGPQKTINLKRLKLRMAGQLQKEKLPKPGRWPLFDRDLSWLSFNDRVLQEAQDEHVPLLERIKFLAIYSSNLDEFYRVRVASLRSLVKLGKHDRTALSITPDRLVAKINAKALGQQQEFGALYRGKLLPALAREKIHILREDQLSAKQEVFVKAFYQERVEPLLTTATMRPGNALFVEDRRLYLVCALRPKGSRKEKRVVVNVPSEELGRFVQLPSAPGRNDLMFLDDVLRLCLHRTFKGHRVIGVHAIKLSRDADLYLEEEFAGKVVDKVRKSLRKRQTGVPSRFLFDQAMPKPLLKATIAFLGLRPPDLVPGGRYHNFSDLLRLPVKERPDLRDKPLPLVPHAGLSQRTDLFRTISDKDQLLHFPYHDFGLMVRWLEQAARDKAVRSISITLYRVAYGSLICQALLQALRNGKQVTVFVEVQARFDERSNLYWGEMLEKAGAKVLYSYEGLKVHGKLCLIQRSERGRSRRYAYLGTGNFNERTAQVYSDMGLLTAQPAITREVQEVFSYLMDRRHVPALRQLLMAPIDLRSRLEEMIDREIEQALKGRPARILLKLNSLEDTSMIHKLYDASRAGVEVRLILRGICCLVPGLPHVSERVRAISIVDRYLEHARVYMFHDRGRMTTYLASADLMERNLDRRVEIAFPLEDAELRAQVHRFLDLQWRDRVKARLIDADQRNAYVPRQKNEAAIQSQLAFHNYLMGLDRRRRSTVKKRTGPAPAKR
ncbi:MAG: polyphosphate kinase 1 [Flavobacteriales bacterium]|nr:polyphosphate kinase 1 [Flavobacteriales bacterium]